ncbi:MAG: arabinosyltransferase domain-containing protein [Pseudonocardia sp.]|nr:arabinosyltransferase domain-containing protein [Pseudonocardia sp.]
METSTKTSADTASTTIPAKRRPISAVLALLVGVIGLAAGLALPFVPVISNQTEVNWPAPGQLVRSSTVILVPYRPAELTVTVPCSALRAASNRSRSTTVLATGGSLDPGGGVLVQQGNGTSQLLVNARLVASAPIPGQPILGASALAETDCGASVTASATGVTARLAGQTITLAGEPVPEVAAFRTDLDPIQAAGLTVTARTVDPFETSPTLLKRWLIGAQLAGAALVLVLLALHSAWVSRVNPRWIRLPRLRWPTVLIDAGVLVTLAGWAVIGPLSDDDGFATMIARNSALAGDQGNYYRWWNASETPFALAQSVLAQLTEVSLWPVWLRLPSTLLGAATWFVLSRGVLGAGAIPGLAAGRAWMRLLAGVCFLAGWLPYDLGVRPEPYVAFGLTALLALLWRAKGWPGVALSTLVAALTMTASPSGLLVLAPILVFWGKIVRLIRADADSRAEVVARVLALGAIGAVALSVVFSDQTLHSVITATRWHTTFGPSLPWSGEPERYRFLLKADQDGTATKRLPVLLTYALLPVVGMALARRGASLGAELAAERGTGKPLDAACARLAGVVAIGLGLLWLTPSKWSHHFGALAGVIAAFLVITVITLVAHALEQPAHRPLDRTLLGTGLIGTVLVAVAAGLTFTGPNDWWQPVVYDVPWSAGPVRPLGLPLDAPPLWLAGGLAVAVLVRLRSGAVAARSLIVWAPGLLAAIAAAVSVAVLLYSFVVAPIRRPAGSLAVANLNWLRGARSCGLADDIQVLPDLPGGVLTPAEPGSGQLTGFAADAGFAPANPPPEPPGVGASAHIWGSRLDNPANTGRMVSQWFALPPLSADQELAMTVSGRTDGGNRLALEFGRAEPAGPRAASRLDTLNDRAGLPDERVSSLGERVPTDQPHDDPRAHPDPAVWRSVWLTRDQVPEGANRVRVLAVDGSSDRGGWLATTGPRLRQMVGLTQFLATHGPVLVNWPIAFLFPCVRNVVGVAHGIADTPRALVEAPGRYVGLADASTDPEVGGIFAILRTLGKRSEIPTRVVGHPDLDWGSMRLIEYPADRDQYRQTRSRVEIPGWTG